MSPKRVPYLIGVLLILVLALAACEAEQVEVTREVEVTRVVEVPGEAPAAEEVEVTRVVEVMPEGAISGDEVPFLERWQGSAHARVEDEAFVHWDEEGVVEIACAQCHSTAGFIDYVGGDGSEPFVVNEAPPTQPAGIRCAACHNDATADLDTVIFPSGATITGLQDEARCMTCHQGRASTVQVNAAIEEAGLVEDPDAVAEDLGFINIHYYAAAATQFGTLAMGGYEYDGKAYDGRFAHVEPFDTCIECHDPHTLEVQVDECTACHEGVQSPEDLVNIRTVASLVDYDGDGNIDEGVMAEIETLQEMLYSAIQAYATEVAGTPIVYSESAYPYFFADVNESGQQDEGDERYASWTPRLTKAAYNYQVSKKDPGEFAHGGKYIIQLLYDSIDDLNSAISTPVDLTAAHRTDVGHFDGSAEAFRHWDEEGFVPASCSKCHSSEGLPFFLNEGVTVSQELSNGLKCVTCHSSLETWERYPVEEVTFPSGATLSTGDSDANLCLNCHQGRQAGVDVDRAVGDLGDDEVGENLRFLNVHYFAAGATRFGSQAGGMYQFPDQEYSGRFEHVGAFDTCIECHSAHGLAVQVEGCANCHEVESVEDLQTIKMEEIDYDGNGDATEGLAVEIQNMEDMLLAAIQDYAANTIGTPIIYNPGRYPYFFADANGNGEIDGEEGGYSEWTPKLLRAAYNYQYVQKDPGAFAHNGEYVIQVLYDTLNYMGADVSGMVRPEVTVAAPAEETQG